MTENKRETFFKRASFAFIVLFSFFAMVYALLTPTGPVGESEDYMITTIALQNRMSIFITQEDIEQSWTDYPEYAGYFYQDRTLFTTKDGQMISAYFPTYSLAALPMKIALKRLYLNQSYAFALTNVLCYIIAMAVVYKCLRRPAWQVFVTLLFVALNPAFYYLTWPESEVFIYAFVVMSLVFFSNRQYKRAALFVSIAGTLNVCIMGYGAVIILAYAMDKYERPTRSLGRNLLFSIRKNAGDCALLVLCFIPSVVPVALNYALFGGPVSMMYTVDMRDYWGRFAAYLFDLNLGLAGYFPVLLLLMALLTIWAALKRQAQTPLLFAGFLLTVAWYSITYHINCGMIAISRYGAWTSPLVFFCILAALPLLSSRRARTAISCALVLSTCVTAVLTAANRSTGWLTMGRPASAVLTKAPALYNPLYTTFITRVSGEFCTYTYERPTAFVTNRGYVTKVLANADTAQEAERMLASATQEGQQKLDGAIERLKSSEGLIYLNFSEADQVTLVP